MAVVFEKVAYGGWSNCYRLANDTVELIVTGDVGPRIIRFGFIGGDNELGEMTEMLGQTGGDTWQLYGGHRLWHAPENDPRSYYPDNQPVTVTQTGDTITVVQPTETTTGIQKEIELYLRPDSAHVQLTHRLTNHNLWPIELAPWALTIMNTGGRAIIPAPPRGSHAENLLPTHTLTLWAYTDMSDPRWTWGEKYIMLRQDTTMSEPQKIGVHAKDGWAAYARDGHLFVKTYGYVPGANYPDHGCTVETFTDNAMLELETVAPLGHLQPGAVATYVENWHLFDGIAVPENDAEIEANVLPKARQALAEHRE
jgi:hypothetical protein